MGGTSGSVESLWRYPVKSMRGEELDEAFFGFNGVYGDRLYAFVSSECPKGFPYFTARAKRDMIRYRPRFRHPERAALPPDLHDAQSLGPGITPLYAGPDDLAVDIETPEGQTLPIGDPAVIESLAADLDEEHELRLVRSDRALTDCRPVSLISRQTLRTVETEYGGSLDARRFRANIYADFPEGEGFVEDGLVGKRVRLGANAEISILERDPRCKMIALDPDTAQSDPKVLRTVAQGHDAMAGVYAAVLVEGIVRPGDSIEVLD